MCFVTVALFLLLTIVGGAAAPEPVEGTATHTATLTATHTATLTATHTATTPELVVEATYDAVVLTSNSKHRV
jgi:hypothetical protein